MLRGKVAPDSKAHEKEALERKQKRKNKEDLLKEYLKL
jgi:hypothetical protein